jgi:hypothetical protein
MTRAAPLVMALLMASACSPSAVAAEVIETTSASGALHVAVTMTPNPPARGVSSARFVLTDDTKHPVDGLTLTIQPWMVQHGHGSPITPEVSAAGQGAYLVTNLYLPMPGLWQLRTTVSGAVNDELTPTLELP